MKTVVLVTDIAFWINSIGSHSRIQRLARAITRSNKLAVFFLRTVTPAAQKGFAALGLENAELVSYKTYSRSDIDFKPVLSKAPFFKRFAADDFCRSFAAYQQENSVDVAVFEYLRLGYLLDVCPPSLRTVLDMHDVMSLRTLSLQQAGLQATIEVDVTTERDLLRRFGKILAISRTDQAYLSRVLGLTNSLYVPCSVDSAPPRECSENGKALIFLGGNTAPNLEGLRWFLSQAWPLLAADDFSLDVVGTVCDGFPKPPAGVRLHGQQDDMQPILAGADIAINPVFAGGGLKIKCLDALAAGLPCVTTVEGAAGLEGALDAGLVVAGSRLDFVAAIKHFAASRVDRQIVAFLAPRYIRGEFSEAVAYSQLDSYISAVPGEPISGLEPRG